MRVFFIYLVLIFSISVKADERERLLVSIDSVFIESVNWHILPDPPATCMTFEECFGNKGKMITDTCSINNLCRLLKSLEKTDETYCDVKCKMYFLSHDTVTATVCVDMYKTFIHGEMYITTQALTGLIDSIVNNIKEFTDYPTPQYPNHTIVSGKEEIWKCLDTYKNASGNLPRKNRINIKCICQVDNKGNIHRVTLIPDKGNELTLSDELANILKQIITKHIKWNEIKERMLSDFITFSIVD